jgi:RNA polymerase sigma factor (sigma-70 family)
LHRPATAGGRFIEVKDVMLEENRLGLPVPERLLEAAGRLLDGRPAVPQARKLSLRPDQLPVFRHFAGYMEDVATRPPAERGPPRCRIVLPPRTGKTVIAGHIIAHTGLVSAFVVPTRALVGQTVRELRQLMPDVPLGAFYGDAKTPVAHGVNVTTYASLKRHLEAGSLPVPLKDSSLVFVDEAHHAMTASRLDALERAFAPEAVRVALTATPDYDHDRRLARHFPDLIHELELDEALALGLLAPVRVWVAEVDADASTVRLLAGDYDVERLGRLMSSGPFFGAVRAFRYQGTNGAMPALIACASRQQARDLWSFLAESRPSGQPPPALVLGETPGAEREETLADFAAGRVDTLVQVGVLIEGWSSPRCKLLIDLAPSVSRVRATQKYFRVMTRHGDQEARIVVLLPRSLPRPPVLPMDLLMGPGEEYFCGALIGVDEPHDRRPLLDGAGSSISHVQVKQRVVVCSSLERPTLDKHDVQQLREVLEACADFDAERPARLPAFRRLWLSHPQFKGSGESLLRWCGVPYWRRRAFTAFMARLYPEAVRARYGEDDGERWISCEEELDHLLARAQRDGGSRVVGGMLLGLGGGLLESRDPERAVMHRRALAALPAAVDALTPRERLALELRFGLGPDPELTWRECGERFEVSRSRMAQVVARAIRRLRRRLHSTVAAP